MESNRDDEIDRNYMVFKELLSSILTDHLGEYALMRDRKIVSYHASAGDAERAGAAAYADGIYSYQLVSSEPVDLGFYSYVLAQGEA
jgi:hypothetical protein